MDIFLGLSQNWTIFRGHFYAFYGLFLRSWYRMGIFFWVSKASNIFRGAWNSWYFWGMKGRCWVRAYVWRKNESSPLGVASKIKECTPPTPGVYPFEENRHNALGSSNSSDTMVLRWAPSSLATSMVSFPVSDQNIFLPTTSTTMPSDSNISSPIIVSCSEEDSIHIHSVCQRTESYRGMGGFRGGDSGSGIPPPPEKSQRISVS